MDAFNRALLFKQVVEQGSLAAAARAMSINPSVVSKRLAELEQQLGVQLLRRTTRRIALTEAGDRFYQQIRPLSSQWQTLLDETSNLGKTPKGKLSIAAPQPLLSRMLLPQVIQFKNRHSGIDVLLQAIAYEQLPLFNADISICRKLETFDSSTTIGVPLCDYRNRLFASPTYLAKHGIPDAIATLSQHQCLAYGTEQDMTWTFEHADFSHKSVTITNALPSDNTEVLINAAVLGQGIVYIPALLITAELRRSELTPLLTDRQSQIFQAWAYFQKMDYIPQKLRVFVDYLKTSYSKT